MFNVLITSVGTATSVGLIKALRRSIDDIRIIGTDINPFGYTAGSQLSDLFYQVSLAASERFQAEIREIVRVESIDLLVPINDSEIEAVSRFKSKLGVSCQCFVPNSEVIGLCRDKSRMNEFAQRCGLECPKTVDPRYLGRRIFRENESVGSKGIRVIPEGCPNPIEVSEKIENGVGFLQEYMPGKEYTVDVLSDRSGRPLFAVPRERLEVKAGIATKVRITCHEQMIEDAFLLATELKIPGFSNIQFRENKCRAPRFIEVNPRFGGCSASSLLAAPSMLSAYVDLVKGRDLTRYEINEDVEWGSIVTRYYEEMLFRG